MTLVDLIPRAQTANRLAELPVAIIGAGPVGLAAAANLLRRGINFVVFEAGAQPAAAVRQWGHTRLFSPWRNLVDPVARELLEDVGWVKAFDDTVAPTGAELVTEYLQPLAELPGVSSRIRYNTSVIAVAREGMDRTRSEARETTPFVVRVRADDSVEEVAVRAVLDASGTYSSPNPLSSNGLETLGAGKLSDRVIHPLPDVLGADRSLFSGRHVTVVGAGHSAANTLIALAQLQREDSATRITWLIRNDSAVRVSSSPDDELADRARLGSRVDQLVADGTVTKVDSFQITRLTSTDDGVGIEGTVRGEARHLNTDVVVNSTGFRPDLSMLREIRTDLDEIVEAPRRLAPLIDPNVHSCGTVEPHGFRELTHPENGFFIVGMKSYGRAPTFLLATGYEQVRSIGAWLSGDMRSASQVELVLPSTGVCSTDGSAGGCC